MQQRGSKNFASEAPLIPTPGGQNSIFTEHIHIKFNRFTNAESWQQIFCQQTCSWVKIQLF